MLAIFSKIFHETVTYSEIFWGVDSNRGFERGKGRNAQLWVQGKALVGTRRPSYQKLKGFSTLKSLTFD